MNDISLPLGQEAPITSTPFSPPRHPVLSWRHPFTSNHSNPFTYATASSSAYSSPHRITTSKESPQDTARPGNPRSCTVTSVQKNVAHLQWHVTSGRMALSEVYKNGKWSKSETPRSPKRCERPSKSMAHNLVSNTPRSVCTQWKW